MQPLNFIKPQGTNTTWVCEFSVNSNYNLHIEFPTNSDVRDTRVFMYQRGNTSHQWAKAYAGNFGPVFDMDFGHTVFPKLVRIELFEKPVLAELRIDE